MGKKGVYFSVFSSIDSRNNTHRGGKVGVSLSGIHTDERTNISSGGRSWRRNTQRAFTLRYS